MDVYIYQEKVRKVKGEEMTFLDPIAVLEDFGSSDEALEALLDADPSYLGQELVIWESAPEYITPEEPTTKYSFARRNGNGAVVEEEAEADVEPEEEDEEPEEVAPTPARRRTAAKKPPARKPAAASSAKKPAGKRPASRAGGRTSSRAGKSPFTKNTASAD